MAAFCWISDPRFSCAATGHLRSQKGLPSVEGLNLA